MKTLLRTLASQIRSTSDLDGPAGALTVSGLADDSRKVNPGEVFFCMPGAKVDGTRFVRDAVARGAGAIVTTHSLETDPGVPVLVVEDPRHALSLGIEALYGEVIGELDYVGVTGTNGKTTTACLTAAVLRAGGIKTAVMGTLGTLREDGSRVPSKNTTPGPLDLLTTLRQLVSEGYKCLVMEVSSQAVVQHRAQFLPFRSSVWTNLSPEHFELHGDLPTYRTVKAGWMEACDGRGRTDPRLRPNGRIGHASIVNVGDPESAHVAERLQGLVIGFHLEGQDPAAGVRSDRLVVGRAPSYDLTGARMSVESPMGHFDVALRLGGHFNLQNALAATCVGLQYGLAPAAIAQGLASVERVPGRFQRVPSAARQVIIDYAHTSEGMENLLRACRPLIEPGAQLVVVFGCGGDRDNSKRSRMGRSASTYADKCVITNDNPRSEDPGRITEMILEGIAAAARGRCRVEHDRRKAIESAVNEAGPRDLVVIAGKGHEDYQLVGDQILHFDDVEVVEQTLAALEPVGVTR